MKAVRLAAVMVIAVSVSHAADAQQPLADSTRTALHRVFAPWAASDGPGCAVGASRNGEVVFQNGYGMANLELDAPITPASIFHVASVSKQFTAAAVMLLAREGRLSLDDDIRTHLPELPDLGHRVTIRHLLQHTSGIRDQWDLLIMARGRFEENRITEDGPALIPLSARRFAVTGQATEIEIAGDTLRMISTAPWPVRSPRLLFRREPARMQRADLERLAGTYYGEELGATYTVRATDTGIVLRTRWSQDLSAAPLYGDIFGGDFWLLAFNRNGQRLADGFTMNSGRVRGVRFTRVAP